MRNKILIGYFFIIGTAFFTAFSYIFGKKVSDDLFPETVAFYWFLGAFIVAVLKRIVFTGLGYKFSVPINELGKYKKIIFSLELKEKTLMEINLLIKLLKMELLFR